MEYINKTRLMQRIHTGMTLIEAMQEIIDAPAADVAPVRRGRWEWDRVREAYRCSSCRKHNADRTAYCPNCGAKMEPLKEAHDEP